MFHHFADAGLNERQIAGLLNHRGNYSPGGRSWTSSSVRRVLRNRTYGGKGFRQERAMEAAHRATLSVDDLKREIVRLAREKELYVREHQSRETRLFQLRDAIGRIRSSTTLLQMLRQHNLDQLPALRLDNG